MTTITSGTESQAWEQSKLFSRLNQRQLEAVKQTCGPLLIIAGPGSGKTTTLVARTANILMRRLARPREVLLCTYTEKAAGELRDRVAEAMRDVGCQDDLSQLLVGTIHGMCNQFIQEHRHLTDLNQGYEVLDELTQSLFLFDKFDEIVGREDESGRYLGHYTTKWGAIKGVIEFFNKITEELIDADALTGGRRTCRPLRCHCEQDSEQGLHLDPGAGAACLPRLRLSDLLHRSGFYSPVCVTGGLIGCQ